MVSKAKLISLQVYKLWERQSEVKNVGTCWIGIAHVGSFLPIISK